MDGLTALFLGVIAINALLQAALVLGLALGVRKASRLLDQAQDRFDSRIRPRLNALSDITRKAADLSDDARANSERLDEAMTEARRKLGDLGERLGDAVTSTAERLEASAPLRRLRRPRGRVFALVKGIWRALEVWQGRDVERAAPPARRRVAPD